jgi:carbon-monoxide dehydrogenase small subunit
VKHMVQLTVNGVQHDLLVRSEETLLETLRDQLHLYGAREGCGVSVCGACTVLVEGEPVSSCIQLTRTVSGKSIETIEGMAAADGTLHPLQATFLEYGALQCAFCTPGILLTAKSILEQDKDIPEDELHDLMSGNLCRCTGYEKIRQALRAVRSRM